MISKQDLASAIQHYQTLLINLEKEFRGGSIPNESRADAYRFALEQFRKIFIVPYAETAIRQIEEDGK